MSGWTGRRDAVRGGKKTFSYSEIGSHLHLTPLYSAYTRMKCGIEILYSKNPIKFVKYRFGYQSSVHLFSLWYSLIGYFEVLYEKFACVLIGICIRKTRLAAAPVLQRRRRLSAGRRWRGWLGKGRWRAPSFGAAVGGAGRVRGRAGGGNGSRSWRKDEECGRRKGCDAYVGTGRGNGRADAMSFWGAETHSIRHAMCAYLSLAACSTQSSPTFDPHSASTAHFRCASLGLARPHHDLHLTQAIPYSSLSLPTSFSTTLRR